MRISCSHPPPQQKPYTPPALWERPYKEGWEGARGESGAENTSTGPKCGLLFGCLLTVNFIWNLGLLKPRMNQTMREVLRGIYLTHSSGSAETSHIPKSDGVTTIM